MWLEWCITVFALMNSSSPICWLVRPGDQRENFVFAERQRFAARPGGTVEFCVGVAGGGCRRGNRLGGAWRIAGGQRGGPVEGEVGGLVPAEPRAGLGGHRGEIRPWSRRAPRRSPKRSDWAWISLSSTSSSAGSRHGSCWPRPAGPGPRPGQQTMAVSDDCRPAAPPALRE
jgi:hypothetical protein